MVYKLVEIDGEGKIKLSPGKKTYPMAKQVDRRRDAQGMFRGDVVMRADETAQGEALLVPIVRAGRLVNDLPALETIRAAAPISSPLFPRNSRISTPRRTTRSPTAISWRPTPADSWIKR